MKYTYVAYRADGSVVNGVIEAGSESDAQKSLRAGGMFPQSVQAVLQRRPARGSLLAGGRLRQLTAFTRQMSVLVSSGTPLADAIAAVKRQMRDPSWRALLEDISEQVEQGASLSDAMARHPRHFDAVYRSLIEAGESGGDMKQLLDRLGAITRQQLVVKNTITGAMVYPLLLITVSMGVLLGLVLFVLPRFETLFETLNAPLPPTTGAMIAVASFLRGNLWEVGVGLFVAGAGGVVFLRSARGLAMIDTLSIAVPLIGPVVRSFKVARLVRVIGILLEARVPLLETLAVARSCAGNAHYEALIDSAEARVQRGESFSEALRDTPLVDQSIAEAIYNGEQTGRVGEVLVTLSDMMDEDNSILVRTLTSVLEPVILALLGVVVGAVALSLFLPLFDLTASTGAH
jgi:type II secretory pathway component PulF